MARGHNNPDHDANDKMALLMHELGHNLGFLHSDQTAGYNIPGTADAAWHSRNTCGSIMRSSVFTCGWRTSGRSAWSTSDWRAVGWDYKILRNLLRYFLK